MKTEHGVLNFMNPDDLCPILAIETSGDLCSVSLFQDERTYSETNVQMKHVHSEILLTLIDQVINNLSISKSQIASIAVSMGPGSFTGLRIGMAAAKSLAIGLNIPIIPVPTFNAIANQIILQTGNADKIAIVNTVNRDELYLQEFIRESGKTIETELKVVANEFIDGIDKSINLYGNFNHSRVINFGSMGAFAIAKWAYFFGQDLVTFDHDYLEPNYIKNFIAKVKK
jgi:tRNA threonylcarbamoyladenosine biosynthesis protein TsaB